MALDENCKHVDEKGLTTTYRKKKEQEPEIKCTQCNKNLSREEFRERVEYVALCHKEGKSYV